MKDYRQATEGLNVVKSVYMEVDVEPAQQAAEADYVLDLIRQGATPLVAAVISRRPASEGFAEYLARYHEQPAIKGLRRVLHGADTPPGHCLEQRFVDDIRLLGKKGLSFDLCMRPAELSDAAKLIDACPDTSFILDHCGNASVRANDLSAWKADIGRIAERKNVVCKVSGIVASAAPGPWTSDDLAPIVNHVMDQFGPDRVVFGGDWPVCTLAATYREWVSALQAIVAEPASCRSEEAVPRQRPQGLSTLLTPRPHDGWLPHLFDVGPMVYPIIRELALCPSTFAVRGRNRSGVSRLTTQLERPVHLLGTT